MKGPKRKRHASAASSSSESASESESAKPSFVADGNVCAARTTGEGESGDVVATNAQFEQAEDFASLGLCREVCGAAEAANWVKPTRIQSAVIPLALEQLSHLRQRLAMAQREALGAGMPVTTSNDPEAEAREKKGNSTERRDIIALAATGSGKTGAFLLPLLQYLLQKKQGASPAFAVILSPTRELALQIFDCFGALASAAAQSETNVASARATAAAIRGCCCALVGGVDFNLQALTLAKKPQVLVCTPGRLIEHLQQTKGFSVKGCRYIVFDEADKLLSVDYEKELNAFLHAAPREKLVLLFSATMTSSVSKLKKACLVNPIKVAVDSKTTTASVLVQQMLLVPFKHKFTYAAALLKQQEQYTCMIFTNTCMTARKLAVFLRHMGFQAICLHGKMPQPQRIGALAKFRAGGVKALVCTEVGSRGLDIGHVQLVVNFDVPLSSKEYIHRVGRTARAGKTGRAVTLVTQYDVEHYQRIEFALNKKFEEYPAWMKKGYKGKLRVNALAQGLPEETALVMHERALQAIREAEMEIKEEDEAPKKQRRNSNKRQRGK